MKRLRLWLAMLSIPFAAAAPAAAKTCTLDVVPAATLLLPYFEVDVADPSGRTTLISINNAAAQAEVARVVLWTDLGVPTLAFDVYLTGYDAQTLNLRDVLAGNLPGTADLARDPGDRTSPKGPVSQDVTVPGCAGLLPPGPVPSSLVQSLRRAHQGLSSDVFGGQCAGQALGDGLARGYVTVDVARRCSLLTPADPGYFGPDGVAGDDNVLWGDFMYVDPAADYAQGENLVRIEADPALFAGRETFYGRYVGFSGADGREPLPTTWGSRFLNGGGAFASGTELVVWRDSRRRATPFLCGRGPSWYPLDFPPESSVFFDEEEHAEIPSCPFECPPSPSPFPAEANRIRFGGPLLPSPFDFGWLYLDLKAGAGSLRLTQAWVMTLASAQGAFSVGFDADQLDSGCAPRTSNPGF